MLARPTNEELAWRLFYADIQRGEPVQFALRHVSELKGRPAADMVWTRLRSLILAVGPDLEVPVPSTNAGVVA